jgi:TonB family protein
MRFSMKLLRFLGCIAVVIAAVAFAPSRAQANVFCPVTIDAVENLAVLGRQNTFGMLLNFDPGLTSSVRVRIDSETTRYAVDFNEIETVGGLKLLQKLYFTLPDGQTVSSAWVESTGTDKAARLACPITQPFDITEPAPVDRTIAAQRLTNRRTVRDAFSSKTPTVTPVAFGPVQKQSCAQPFSPPRAIQPAVPVYPAEARAVKAVGTATVRVDLDETSSVVDAIIMRSSGYAPLDRAARDAALKSSYRTESFACRSIASSFPFVVVFNGP